MRHTNTGHFGHVTEFQLILEPQKRPVWLSAAASAVSVRAEIAADVRKSPRKGYVRLQGGLLIMRNSLDALQWFATWAAWRIWQAWSMWFSTCFSPFTYCQTLLGERWDIGDTI